MRAKTANQFIDGPTGTSLIRLLATWWLEAEGVLARQDTVDHRADAARARYTKTAFEARVVAVALADRGERRAAGECFDAFAVWASSHAARQVTTWLREAIARPTDPLRPEKAEERVRREITAAIRPAAPGRRNRGPAAGKFDGEGNLDYVIESSRVAMNNNFASG